MLRRLRQPCRSDIMRPQSGGTAMHARALAAGQAGSGLRSEIGAMAAALLLGVFVVFVAGFAGASALHEAAHNTRHSLAFPCH
jgi:cobalt transporter subunit CbtB